MTDILIAAAVVGVVGIILGIFLSVASEKFEVKVDEKEVNIREQLPGNNCGGCGFAGCDALAKAIANGEAAVNACPVGGENVAKLIAEIMGVNAGESERFTAFVKCAGTCDKTKDLYDYVGPQTCSMMPYMQNSGKKICTYGCTGFGDCVKACEFGAISIIDGIAVVDKDKCKACKKCIAACPKNLIELVPYAAEVKVQCNSNDKGVQVKKGCSQGCIGCMLCTKQCEVGAITVTNNLAHIDYTKCTGCGKCAKACPVKVISIAKSEENEEK